MQVALGQGRPGQFNSPVDTEPGYKQIQGMQSLNSGLQPQGQYSGPARIGGGGQPPVGGVGGTGQQSTLTPAQRSMMLSHLS